MQRCSSPGPRSPGLAVDATGSCAAPLLLAGCGAVAFSSQISHFKIPRYIVFVSQYPLTVSGKVRGAVGRGMPCPAVLSEPLHLCFVSDSEIQVERADGEAPSALSSGRRIKQGINWTRCIQPYVSFSPMPCDKQWRASLPALGLMALSCL